MGNDSITHIAAGDVAYGGSGHDSLSIDSTGFKRAAGNLGDDTLTLAGFGMTLDFAALARPSQHK